MSAQREEDWYANWQPGEPLLNDPGLHAGYRRNPIFNFREDSDQEHCAPCPDAAAWPNPRDVHDLDKGLYANVGRDWID